MIFYFCKPIVHILAGIKNNPQISIASRISKVSSTLPSTANLTVKVISPAQIHAMKTGSFSNRQWVVLLSFLFHHHLTPPNQDFILRLTRVLLGKNQERIVRVSWGGEKFSFHLRLSNWVVWKWVVLFDVHNTQHKNQKAKCEFASAKVVNLNLTQYKFSISMHQSKQIFFVWSRLHMKCLLLSPSFLSAVLLISERQSHKKVPSYTSLLVQCLMCLANELWWCC